MKKLLILSAFLLTFNPVYAEIGFEEPGYWDINDASTAIVTNPSGLDLGTVANPVGDIYAGTLSISSLSMTGDLTIESAIPTINFKDTDTVDGDVNAKRYTDCTDTGSGTEDCDDFFQQQINGVMTTYLTADADDDIRMERDVYMAAGLEVEGPNRFNSPVVSYSPNGTRNILIQHNNVDGAINTSTGKLFSNQDTTINGNLVVRDTSDFNDGVSFFRAATASSGNSTGQTILGVTDTAAPRTITLDTDDTLDGHIVIIKDESGAAGTNNITIDTEGIETIDGVNSIAITVNYGVARVYSDGTNWFTF
jgi:hypothetical protein